MDCLHNYAPDYRISFLFAALLVVVGVVCFVYNVTQYQKFGDTKHEVGAWFLAFWTCGAVIFTSMMVFQAYLQFDDEHILKSVSGTVTERSSYEDTFRICVADTCFYGTTNQYSRHNRQQLEFRHALDRLRPGKTQAIVTYRKDNFVGKNSDLRPHSLGICLPAK